MVELRELAGRRQLRDFVRVPFDLYGHCPQWVPPLIREELDTLDSAVNPAFEQAKARYWLALYWGRAVGRVAAISLPPRSGTAGKTPLMRFGWFDAIDDAEVARALLAKVEHWAVEEGADHVNGPHGFCDLDPQGTLIEGFDQLPTIFTYYNHPYYPRLLEDCGYRKEIDYIEYRLRRSDNQALPEKVVRAARLVEKRGGVRLLTFTSRRQALAWAKPMMEVLNESFADIYGFTPLTARQIDYYRRKLFFFLEPRLLVGVLNPQERLVGFAIAMPSLSRAFQRARGRLWSWGWWHLWRGLHERHTVDFCLVGVRGEYQGKGVPFLLQTWFHDVAMQMGFQYAESNPILENNLMSQGLFKYFQPQRHKRRRIFRKDLA